MENIVRRFLFVFLTVLVFGALLFPNIYNSEEAAANVHPWADSYGFLWTTISGNPIDSFGCMEGYSFQTYTYMDFSGIRENNSAPYPSTHYALTSRGWSSTTYLQNPASRAVTNLPGNALFCFFGNTYDMSGRHLIFYTFTGKSYLVDTPRSTDPPDTCYYLIALRGLDDMKFALFLACRSARDNYGDGNSLSAIARFHRGVDIVVGFNERVCIEGGRWFVEWRTIRPGHCWNTEFWRASQLKTSPHTYSVAESCDWATYWTSVHCLGLEGTGVDSYRIFGANNDARGYIRVPGDGKNEGVQ